MVSFLLSMVIAIAVIIQVMLFFKIRAGKKENRFLKQRLHKEIDEIEYLKSEMNFNEHSLDRDSLG